MATLVPIVLGLADYLPPQYAAAAAAVHAVITLLSVFGVYHVPNQPADTSIVPNDQIITLPPNTGYTPVPDVPVTPVRPGGVGGSYVNPWRP
jgi:hypothetical protein